MPIQTDRSYFAGAEQLIEMNSRSCDTSTDITSNHLHCVHYNGVQSAEETLNPTYDLTISFSCGGWFLNYFLGVANALVKSGLLEFWERTGKRVRFCGSSIGSLVAACLAFKRYDFEAIMEYTVRAAIHHRSSWRNIRFVKKYIKDGIDLFGWNVKEISNSRLMQQRVANGRLEVAITTLPRLQSKFLTNFKTWAETKEALLASCSMVPLVGMPMKMRCTGEWAADGAISNFTPRMTEDNCISVSPMYFQDASVHPHFFIPSWWAIIPPDERRYRNLFWIGHNDMIEYLVNQNFISPEHGRNLIKEEIELRVFETYSDVIFTVFMETTMLIWVRPVVAVCIYVELLISMIWYALRSFTTWNSSDFVKLYECIRNAISLRTLARVFVSSRVPSNEERLSRHSKIFAWLDPVIHHSQRHHQRTSSSGRQNEDR